MAGLDITQHATSEPVPLSWAKRQCQIESGITDDDEYLGGLIRAARETAELHTNRSYLTRGFREYFDRFPEQRLPIPYNVIYDIPSRHQFETQPHNRFELSRSPLQRVVQIQYLDQNGDQQTLDPSIYYVAPHQEPAHIVRQPPTDGNPPPAWPWVLHRADSVWVDYFAGYGNPVTLSMGAVSAITSGADFALTDVGRQLSVPLAGPSVDGALTSLVATILSVDVSGNATLSAPAVNAVSGASAWLGLPLAGVAQRAMLLLITHWYENRLPIAAAGLKELPYGIKSMLDNNRVYYQP
jgi:hypothetical protein